MCRLLTHHLPAIIYSVFLLLSPPADVLAKDGIPQQLEPRSRLSPVSLQDGSSLHLNAPPNWHNLSSSLIQEIQQLHSEYLHLFKHIPKFELTLSLMEKNEFYKKMNVPTWTNAMYYQKQITIPLPTNENIDYLNLTRAIKHEYTHAIIHSMSSGKCPGWLDEGLAQLKEDSENQILAPALREWVPENGNIPLASLQGGFTKLHSHMVPAAYGQSLFSAKQITQKFGYSALRGYLADLRANTNPELAFRRNFNMNLKSYENLLSQELLTWSKKGHWIAFPPEPLKTDF